jgi:hypothetical protein
MTNQRARRSVMMAKVTRSRVLVLLLTSASLSLDEYPVYGSSVFTVLNGTRAPIQGIMFS